MLNSSQDDVGLEVFKVAGSYSSFMTSQTWSSLWVNFFPFSL